LVGTNITGTAANFNINGTVGATTPTTGAFTTLSASSSVTLSGGTANGVTYLNGSKVLTSGSALTFDGTTFKTSAAGTSVSLSQSTVNSGVAMSRVSGLNGSGTAVIFDQGINLVNANAFELYDRQNSQSVDTYVSGSGGYRALFINGSEQMRLTSTGLGIGTSSPTTKLEIAVASGSATQARQFMQVSGAGAAASFLRLTNTGADGVLGIADSGGGAIVTGGSAYATQLYTVGATSLQFGTNSSIKATLDSSGNLGIGTSSPSTKLDIRGSSVGGNFSAISVDNTAAGSGSPANTVSINFSNGGAAKNSITGAVYGDGYLAFATNDNTEKMRLTASGNLGIGTSSPAAKLHVVNTVYVKGSASSDGDKGITIGSGSGAVNTSSHAIRTGGGLGDLLIIETETANSSGQILFNTNNAERARIDSSGNLLVGTTSALGSYKLQLNATGSTYGFISKTDTTASTCGVSWNAATTGDNSFALFGTEASFTTRGSISYNRAGGLTAYNTTSDYRAKDILGPVVGSGSLIDSTPVYMGKMKGATQERPMFIAHETPSYAHTGEKDAVDEDGNPVYQQMDASALIPVMWAEIQSLRKRLADAGIA
jgi:hypothetical protein